MKADIGGKLFGFDSTRWVDDGLLLVNAKEIASSHHGSSIDFSGIAMTLQGLIVLLVSGFMVILLLCYKVIRDVYSRYAIQRENKLLYNAYHNGELMCR